MNSWAPRAIPETWQLRAHCLKRIRSFFEQLNVLEVDTPILSRAASSDPVLSSFETRYVGLGGHGEAPLFLHTSPEYPMKRMLAAGSGSIYQVCKVFRNGEQGRQHSPEFTMLEWYRVGLGYHELMDEVAELIRVLFENIRVFSSIEKLSYREAFLRFTGIDPFEATLDELHLVSQRLGIELADSYRNEGREFWLDLILTHAVEPELGQTGMTFIYDYPAEQAALARVRQGDPSVAERFELYINGIELANGFQELTDGQEQLARFESDLQTRKLNGLPEVPLDQRLVGALIAGLPECSGVALGFDRLIQLAVGVDSIDEVLNFPFDRA